MNILAVFPGEKDMAIGWHSNGQLVGTATVPYPDCSCAVGESVETVCSTLGIENADMGITCYGMLRPTSNHVTKLTPDIVDEVCQAKYGYDKTNYGTIMLASIGAKEMINTYPLTYDIFPETMRFSGIPQIERKMIGHSLDHILARNRVETVTGSKKASVTCYLSEGEITISSWKDGVLMDMNDSWDGEGPMTPTRSGFFHQKCVYKMAFSGKYDLESMLARVRSIGGLFAHLGTSNLTEVEDMIAKGDSKAKLVYGAMVYQIAKCIGRMATRCGKPDGIAFTGPLACDEKLVADVTSYTSFMAKPIVAPAFDGVSTLIGSITNHG